MNTFIKIVSATIVFASVLWSVSAIRDIEPRTQPIANEIEQDIFAQTGITLHWCEFRKEWAIAVPVHYLDTTDRAEASRVLMASALDRGYQHKESKP